MVSGITADRNLVECSTTYTVTIYDADLMAAHFDRIDMLLLDECNGSRSCADALLGLETIVRRIEESKKGARQLERRAAQETTGETPV